MADQGLLPAVKVLVRRLRQYLRPSGNPPEAAEWLASCSQAEHDDPAHPLISVNHRLAWLAGDPQSDQLLHSYIQRFEPIKKLAFAINRIERLLRLPGEVGHFRTVWAALLDASWINSICKAQTVGDDRPTYSIGFTASVIEEHLLTDLVEAAELAGLIGQSNREQDARDKWIYQQCFKGVPYQTIALKLPKKNRRWPRISSKQGILAVAHRFARKHDLPLPPRRQQL